MFFKRKQTLFGLPGVPGLNLNLSDERKAQMKAIADSHGGQVTLRDTGPATGTTAELSFPGA